MKKNSKDQKNAGMEEARLILKIKVVQIIFSRNFTIYCVIKLFKVALSSNFFFFLCATKEKWLASKNILFLANFLWQSCRFYKTGKGDILYLLQNMKRYKVRMFSKQYKKCMEIFWKIFVEFQEVVGIPPKMVILFYTMYLTCEFIFNITKCNVTKF